MHFLVSEDFHFILFRHITDSYFKEKWVIYIEEIENIKIGYE